VNGRVSDSEPPLREKPHPQDQEVEAEGLATGLQPGGLIPGGGPGSSVGSFGTGGGSNADTATGDADENDIEEEVR
jgi:hypothetical protein